MPVLEHKEAIRQYYELAKGEYPDLTYEEFEEVCKSAFIHVKETIRSRTPAKISMKYLGTFKIFPKRVVLSQGYLEDNKLRGILPDGHYEERKKFLQDILKTLENVKQDKEHDKSIQEIEIIE